MRIQNVQSGAIARVRYKRFNESLVLEPWLELAILTLIKDGERFEAHLVTRGEKTEEPPAYRHFVLMGNTNEERIATARIVLSCVEGMHTAASKEAIPYFERASHDLNAGAVKNAGEKLSKDLEYSAATAYAFSERDADSIFGEKATDTDYQYLGIPAPEDPEDREDRAKLYADHVWGAFGNTTSIIAATGGESPNDDEGDSDGE
jgi:hypothetical protein